MYHHMAATLPLAHAQVIWLSACVRYWRTGDYCAAV